MNNFKSNENFKYYMYFISERMNIFWNRYNCNRQPYTNDEILQKHKFTNVYRVLDRSSQYLLNNVIYNGKDYSKEDMFWRILLYKHFNLPSTWDLLINEFDDITLEIPIDEINKFLFNCIKNNKLKIYSNAYMLTASFMKNDDIKYKYGIKNNSKKHDAYLQIFKHGILDTKLHEKILNSGSLKEAFLLFNSVITVGVFLAYQYVQDINYTDIVNWDDNEFCSAGPGTQRGIERCFDITGKADYSDIVKWVHNNFEQLCEDYNIKFKELPNHLPTVPDLSNCFCETDKYLRGMGVKTEGKEIDGKRIKQLFNENSNKIEYCFPSKWNVII